MASTKGEVTPIAIVGMSCRLPGEVMSLDDFWRLMCRSRNGWSKIPGDRFNKDAYHHPNAEKTGSINSEGGYFLKQDLSLFDAPFFRITKEEAQAMDPQQRILLECAYEALENSGTPMSQIDGRKVGVFIGAAPSDYRMANMRDLDTTPMFDTIGNQEAFLAGRISYFFNLKGPSLTIDTACSSSLSALHLAVQSIRTGESEQAIVGASHVNLLPDYWVSMSNLHLFSDEGRTYAFDHRAKSGYARGEGAGCLVLKPLHVALDQNDRIRAVIRNTGINHNGTTVGIVAPSAEQQERLIKDTCLAANIDVKDIGFVETHGTGTRIGDPIEAAGIHGAIASFHPPGKPLRIGSVKTNIGHLENASGIVSVIKSAMMLERGFILPNVNFERPNDEIPVGQWNLEVPTRQVTWPGDKKYACINNFGFSGVNGHCILERPPPVSEFPGEHQTWDPMERLFVLSAADRNALEASMTRLGIFLEQHAELFQATLGQNLAYTLGERRSHLPWRAAFVSRSCTELVQALNKPPVSLQYASCKPLKLAFVFTGQGAQWHAMGRELLKSHATFASTIRKADEHLLSLGAEFSLLEELLRDQKTSQVGLAYISQPACTAIQLALTDLLASWGIEPSSVVGHSSGEIAAAYAAKALTVESAMELAYYRGQSVLQLKRAYPDRKGAMMAVGVGAAALKELLSKTQLGEAVVVACENSPTSTTLSGNAEAISQLTAVLEKESIFYRTLRVEVAYHSPEMGLVAESYHHDIRHIEPLSPSSNVDFYSSLHARKITATELNSKYWTQNLTNPVYFAAALKELYGESAPNVFIEVGPHAALQGPVKQTLHELIGNTEFAYLPTLVRNRNATSTCLELAGHLFTRGAPLDFFQINHARNHREELMLVSVLPPYPWTRQSFWHESRISRQHRFKPLPRNDLLGSLADYSDDISTIWRKMLRVGDASWLVSSTAFPQMMVPVSVFISMGIEALSQQARSRNTVADSFTVQHIRMTHPLLLDEDAEYEVVLTLSPEPSSGHGAADFRIRSWEKNRGWLSHCCGQIVAHGARAGSLSKLPSRPGVQALDGHGVELEKTITKSQFYEELRRHGWQYPKSMQWLDDIQLSETEMVAHWDSSTLPSTAFAVPPDAIESVLQLSFFNLHGHKATPDAFHAPNYIYQLFVDARTLRKRSLERSIRMEAKGPVDQPRTHVQMESVQSSGIRTTVISLNGLEMAFSGKMVSTPEEMPRLCYTVQWVPATDKGDTDYAANFSLSISGQFSHKELYKVLIISERTRDHPSILALERNLLSSFHTEIEVSPLVEADPEGKVCIFLSEIDELILSRPTENQFLQLQKALISSVASIWVAHGGYQYPDRPHANLCAGLLRTIRTEHEANAALIELNPISDLGFDEQSALVVSVTRRLLATETPKDFEYAEDAGQLMVPRIVEAKEINTNIGHLSNHDAILAHYSYQPSRNLPLRIGTPSESDTLHFNDVSPPPPKSGQIEIQVAASGITSSGNTAFAQNSSPYPYIGNQVSGIVSRVGSSVTRFSVGDKVCAISHHELCTSVTCDSAIAVEVPDWMNMEEAASIPATYFAAHYVTIEAAAVTECDSVIIEWSGEFALAAIQLAKVTSADVYVAVRNDEDRTQVSAMGCGITDTHIFDSRSPHFSREVEDATGGKGASVVITFARPEQNNVGSCIADFGRLVQVRTSAQLGDRGEIRLAGLKSNYTVTVVDLDSLVRLRPKTIERVLLRVMKLFRDRKLTLKPPAVFSTRHTKRAIDEVANGRNKGPVVVANCPDDQVQVTYPRFANTLRYPESTHLIVGCGGLGLCIARWMMENGARCITLVSRTGTAKEGLQDVVNEARSRGALVTIKKCDVSNETEVQKLVAELVRELPPIRGVIHAAMVLRDMPFEKMTAADFNEVMPSKVTGVWNLHNALVNLRLEYFVVLSSIAGVIGSNGQAAYAAANTFLDSFARYRARCGLAGTAISLPPVLDAGFILEHPERKESILKNFGGQSVQNKHLLAILGTILAKPHLEEHRGHVLVGFNSVSDSRNLPSCYSRDLRFQFLLTKENGQPETRQPATQTPLQAIQTKTRDASFATEASSVISQELSRKLSSILGRPVEEIHSQRSIAAYGLDSLNAIELRNWIAKELKVNFQVLELLTSDSVYHLSQLIIGKMVNRKAQ